MIPVLLGLGALVLLARHAGKHPPIDPYRLPLGHPEMGIGDAIARATSAAGIRQCQPCKERQAALNRWGRLG